VTNGDEAASKYQNYRSAWQSCECTRLERHSQDEKCMAVVRAQRTRLERHSQDDGGDIARRHSRSKREHVVVVKHGCRPWRQTLDRRHVAVHNAVDLDKHHPARTTLASRHLRGRTVCECVARAHASTKVGGALLIVRSSIRCKHLIKKDGKLSA
jgi:hypothetical protein